MLKITPKVEKKKALITLEGRLDTQSARDFEKTVTSILDSVDEVVIDCQELEYISSAGLRVLLFALNSKKKKNWLKMTNVNEQVLEILDMTGFTDDLVIE